MRYMAVDLHGRPSGSFSSSAGGVLLVLQNALSIMIFQPKYYNFICINR
jgi:hypothetical protein